MARQNNIGHVVRRYNLWKFHIVSMSFYSQAFFWESVILDLPPDSDSAFIFLSLLEPHFS